MTSSDISSESAPMEQVARQEPYSTAPLGRQRPNPSGIGGVLRFLALIAMIAPLYGQYSLVVLARLREMMGEDLGIAHPAIYSMMAANIVFVAILSICAFAAGYLVYSGSRRGRAAAILFCLLLLIGRGVLIGFIPATAGKALRSVLVNSQTISWLSGVYISIICLFYLALSPRCRNTYDRRYADSPIRSRPLSRGVRCLLLYWGVLSGVSVLVYGGYLLMSPTRGDSDHGKGETTMHVVDIGDVGVKIPQPLLSRGIEKMEMRRGKLTVMAMFMAKLQGRQSIVYTVGAPSELIGMKYSSSDFEDFKELFRDNLRQAGDTIKIVAEEPLFFMLAMQVAKDGTSGIGEMSNSEAYVLLGETVIRLSATMVGEDNDRPDDSSGLCRAWTESVIAANR